MARRVTVFRREYAKKVHWGIRYYVGGKEKKEIIGFSKREAQNAAQEKAAELKTTVGLKNVKVGIEDLFDEYMQRKRQLTNGSRKRYKNNFDAFNEFMQDSFPAYTKDITKIQRHHIEEFLDHLLKKKLRAKKTINGALGFINSLFIYAKKEDYILKSPSADIEKFPENTEKEAPYFTRDELLKIWKEVDSYWLNFLQILYYTGMRKGELINLAWKNVTLKKDEEKITVISSDDYRTKTGKKRTIPLKKEAIKIIKMQKGIDKKYVFVSRNGMKIHPDKPYHAMKKALEKAGLEGDVHKLRHTFASHCVMKGRSIFEVKELLGHRDIQTTMIYAHLSPNTLKDAVNVLESFPT